METASAQLYADSVAAGDDASIQQCTAVGGRLQCSAAGGRLLWLWDFIASVVYWQGGIGRHLYTCCGSPAYAAPELIAGKQYLGSEVCGFHRLTVLQIAKMPQLNIKIKLGHLNFAKKLHISYFSFSFHNSAPHSNWLLNSIDLKLKKIVFCFLSWFYNKFWKSLVLKNSLIAYMKVTFRYQTWHQVALCIAVVSVQWNKTVLLKTLSFPFHAFPGDNMSLMSQRGLFDILMF